MCNKYVKCDIYINIYERKQYLLTEFYYHTSYFVNSSKLFLCAVSKTIHGYQPWRGREWKWGKISTRSPPNVRATFKVSSRFRLRVRVKGKVKIGCV